MIGGERENLPVEIPNQLILVELLKVLDIKKYLM